MMAVTIPAMSKGSSLEEDGNPSDWPSSFPEFKELEMILSCGICFEYLSTTMVTKCSHNFCSLCIRRYMCYKLQCPICKEPIFEHELRNNRIVDDIIQNFTQSRARVLALMRSDCSSRVSHLNSATFGLSKQTAVHNIPEKSASSPDLISEKCSEGEPLIVGMMSGTLCSPNKSVSSNANDVTLTLSPPSLLNADCDSDVVTNPAVDKCQVIRPVPDEGGIYEERSNQGNQMASTTADEEVLSASATPYSCELLSPSPSSSLHSPEMSTSSSFFMSAPSVSNFGLQSPAATTVSCPVCNTDVPSRNINLHLDRCLELGKKKDPPANLPMKRKQLPKLVYTLLADKDLRKRLNEVGLPTSGNRQAMIKRHHEFTLMYNAQCDSLNPKSVQEIVNEIIQNDAAKSRTPSRPVSSVPLKIDKHSSEEQVEKAQKEYVKQHKTQFSELVAAARRNRRDESGTVKPSTVIDLPGESSSMNANTLQDDDDGANDFFCFGVGMVSTSSSQSMSLDPLTIASTVDSENEDFSELRTAEMMASKAFQSQSSSVSLESEFDSVTDCKVIIRSRRVRRQLDQSAFSNVHDNCTASTDAPELESEIPVQTSVVTRRILRSCARKNKHSPEPLMPNELNEEFDNIVNDDEGDDDYEIPSSISGKKRKSRIHSKGQFKARKSENDAEISKP